MTLSDHPESPRPMSAREAFSESAPLPAAALSAISHMNIVYDSRDKAEAALAPFLDPDVTGDGSHERPWLTDELVKAAQAAREAMAR